MLEVYECVCVCARVGVFIKLNMHLCVCVFVCVLIKVHITAQSGPVILSHFCITRIGPRKGGWIIRVLVTESGWRGIS